MNRNKIITIIIFGLMILVTAFVLIKTDFASKIFKTKADITLQSNEAMFLPGEGVNEKMKQLAGNSSAQYTTKDEIITNITKSSTIPSNYKTDNYKVSISNSPKAIYMWFDNGTIYYYTEATKIYLNEDSSYMFYNLAALETLDVSKFDTSNVTNMRYMFYRCSHLTSIDVSSFNTSNVTNMSGMFGCCGITTLNLSNFDTRNVTNMFNMFYWCSLTSITFGSNWNTSKVTDMSCMFKNCESLISIDLSKFNTNSAINIEQMFIGCRSLTSLDLSTFDTSKVEDMDSMFRGCRSLTNLIFGSNWNTSNVTDMSGMFSGCRSLTTLDLSKFNTSKVTKMDIMFSGCRSLTSLDLSNFDTSKVTNMSNMFEECLSLTTLDVSSFNTSNVIDMSFMFNFSRVYDYDLNCYIYSKLTNIIGLNKFNTSKVTNMSGMFEGIPLESIDISKFNTSNVTDMSEMFQDCENLETIYVSTNFITTSETDSDAMFSGCVKLKGERGTVYDENFTNRIYAVIDSENKSGYFSAVYTIVYHGNGGTYNDSEIYIDTRKFKYNVLYPGSNSDKPIIWTNQDFYNKTGYDFDKWTTKAGYDAWEPGYTGDEDKLWKWRNTERGIGDETPYQLDLYAQWTPKEYDVIFEGNGGTYQESTRFIEKATYNELFSFDSSYGSRFIKPGYVFSGWCNNADGTGTKINSYSKTWIWDEGWTLYATWTAKTYDIVLDGNGGTHDDSTTYTVTATYNETFNIEESWNSWYGKKGYIFAGWNTKEDGSGISYTAFSGKWIYDNGLTLYAMWEPITYTIKFDANGGVGTMSDITKTYGVPITAPKNVFTKEGYKFKNWNLYMDGSHVTSIDDEGTIGNLTTIAGKEMTLYAIWEEIGQEEKIIDLTNLDVREDKIMFNEIKTLNELKQTLQTEEIILKDKEGNVKSNTSKLGTGNTLTIGDTTYTLSVKGDLSGDGKTEFEDVFSSYYYFKNSNQLNDIYRYAADFNGDNLVEFEDVFSMYHLFKNSTN